jgi:hypothetical protein
LLKIRRFRELFVSKSTYFSVHDTLLRADLQGKNLKKLKKNNPVAHTVAHMKMEEKGDS